MPDTGRAERAGWGANVAGGSSGLTRICKAFATRASAQQEALAQFVALFQRERGRAGVVGPAADARMHWLRGAFEVE